MNRQKLTKLLILILLIALIIWVGINYRDQINIATIQQAIASVGIWGPIIFILIYISATVLFLPGSVLTLAGGLIFGPIFGVIYSLSGAVIGATIAFLISRYIASDWVAEKIGGRLKRLYQGVEQEGWKFVAITRLVPLLPFNMLNYALGITKVGLVPYIIASAIFMLPGCIAYTYVGSLGETFIMGGGVEIVTRVAIGIGLLILVACIPWVVKKIRKGKPGLVELNGDDDND